MTAVGLGGVEVTGLSLLHYNDMVWGDGERYNHDTYRRITRITPIGDGLGREVLNKYNDTTGEITTTENGVVTVYTPLKTDLSTN